METIEAVPESATPAGTPPCNKEIVRLVDLLHQFDVSEQKDVALQNIANHLTKHFQAELLPVMDRLSKWDESGAAAFFYAKSALQKNHVKLAQKTIDPLLVASGAPDATLLLGSRIYVRLRDTQRARDLLARIPSGSPLEKGIREVEGKIDAVTSRDGSASTQANEVRA